MIKYEKTAWVDGETVLKSDFAIGNFRKATSEWQYIYATSCPQNWSHGFPV